MAAGDEVQVDTDRCTCTRSYDGKSQFVNWSLIRCRHTWIDLRCRRLRWHRGDHRVRDGITRARWATGDVPLELSDR